MKPEPASHPPNIFPHFAAQVKRHARSTNRKSKRRYFPGLKDFRRCFEMKLTVFPGARLKHFHGRAPHAGYNCETAEKSPFVLTVPPKSLSFLVLEPEPRIPSNTHLRYLFSTKRAQFARPASAASFHPSLA